MPFTRALLLLVLLTSSTAAQTPARDRAATPAASNPASERESALARGWTALAQGKAAAAVTAADAVLKTRPWDHAAQLLKIEGLSIDRPIAALDAYEAWQGPQSGDDPGLLEPIARGVLRQLSSNPDPVVHLEALRQLAACRVPAARAALADAPANVVTDAELVKQGDAQALSRLQAAAAAEGANKPAIAKALASTGQAGLPVLLKLATATDVPTRIAAVAALGSMRAESARSVLQRTMKDPDPMVRAWSAVGLFRLQDPVGITQIDQMLASGVPDLQLLAAEAWDGQTGPWVSALRPLLTNRDGLVRFQAARLIAPVDPEAAKQVFSEGLADPNPIVRAETARLAGEMAAEQPGALDWPRLRQLLRSNDATMQLRAAVAILSGTCRGAP
jgi:HEAT repeat protein